MIRKILLKFSGFLNRTHLYIDRLCTKKDSFVPYKLNYQPSTSKPKIVHINGNFIVGGSTQLIVDIIERTSDKYTHKVVVPDYPDPLPYQPIEIKKFSIDELMLLYEYLKNENPALVHIHYWVRHIHRLESYALWYGAVFKICEELKLKVVQNINVPTENYLSTSVVHNVFVSKYVMSNFSTGEVPSSVIYPGSDFSHFKNDKFDTLPNNTIGMVYRLDTDKLNAKAIEVFIAAVKKNRTLLCYIIGEGYYFNHYKRRVAEEELNNHFVFTGAVSYNVLPEYYKKFGVFVAPVHDESFGQVTPFAMSMGLSVAGYDTGALSEILGYKNTLVEYGNIEALSDVIVDLATNSDKRTQLGKINQKRAQENFTVEEMIAQYRKLYEAHTVSLACK